MESSSGHSTLSRYWLFFVPVVLVITTIVAVQSFEAANGEPAAGATYAHGTLDLTIPYHSAQGGAGKLSVEVLDPEDHVLGSVERTVDAVQGKGHWRERIALTKPLPTDELVWHRVRYRFEYSDGKAAKIEGTESISEILRTPVVHILGQQSYLTGGEAAVRVIVTDSHDEIIAGRGSVRIELLIPDQKSHLLFSGQLNGRGTTEAQFRFPSGVAGNYQLRYLVDTAIGSTEFMQSVRLEDKVSILLTTEKPIYQPGQMIHARALALDRANHERCATARRDADDGVAGADVCAHRGVPSTGVVFGAFNRALEGRSSAGHVRSHEFRRRAERWRHLCGIEHCDASAASGADVMERAAVRKAFDYPFDGARDCIRRLEYCLDGVALFDDQELDERGRAQQIETGAASVARFGRRDRHCPTHSRAIASSSVESS